LWCLLIAHFGSRLARRNGPKDSLVPMEKAASIDLDKLALLLSIVTVTLPLPLPDAAAALLQLQLGHRPGPPPMIPPVVSLTDCRLRPFLALHFALAEFFAHPAVWLSSSNCTSTRLVVVHAWFGGDE